MVFLPLDREVVYSLFHCTIYCLVSTESSLKKSLVERTEIFPQVEINLLPKLVRKVTVAFKKANQYQIHTHFNNLGSRHCSRSLRLGFHSFYFGI